jgi:transcriptional regulator with XRE-family HTH domain
MNNRLKDLRNSKKLTTEKMAKILKIEESSIINWEEGRENPSIEELIILSTYFNVTIDYIVKGRNILDKNTSCEHTKKELSKHYKISKKTNGFLYGKYKKQLISNKPNERIGNTLVLGCAGSGKNSSIINPNLEQSIKNKNSIIVTDVNCELFQQHGNRLKENNYNVLLFNICNLSDGLENTLGIDILSEFNKNEKIDEELFNKYIKRLYEILIFEKILHNNDELLIFKTLMYNAIKNKETLKATIEKLNELVDLNIICEYLKEIDYNNNLKKFNNEELYNLSKNLSDKLKNKISNVYKEALSVNEFKLLDILKKNTILFLELNCYDNLFYNQLIGFLLDILSDKLIEGYIETNIDVYFDEFFGISNYMESINVWLKDFKKKYIDRIRVSIFYQHIDQIEYNIKNSLNNETSIIDFLNLFDTVITLGIISKKDALFIEDYMGLKDNLGITYLDLQLMKIKEMLICRKNKTFIIEKNIYDYNKDNKIDIKEYRKIFLDI